MRIDNFLLAHSILGAVELVQSFAPRTRTTSVVLQRRFFCDHVSLSLSASSDDDNPEKNNEDQKSVDQFRKELESLLGTSSSISSQDDPASSLDWELLFDPTQTEDIESMLPPPPPLTSTERDRRLLEIELLDALATSDDGSGQLWELWYSERGLDAKQRLAQADQYLAQGQSVICEDMLKKLVQEHGVYWVEPLNRLATIYFLQNRLEESYKLCMVVLYLKPWHFGALSGIVQVCTRLGDRDNARSWAKKCLPPLVASSSFPPFDSSPEGPTNPERLRWVENAKQQAQEALSHLEYQTQRDFLGSPEEYYKENQVSKIVGDLKKEAADDGNDDGAIQESDDAWQ